MSYHLPGLRSLPLPLIWVELQELSKTDFRKTNSQEPRCTLVTPAPREREACKELEAGLGYRVRLYLKKPKPNKQKPTLISLESKSNTVLFCFVFLLSLAHNPRRGH